MDACLPLNRLGGKQGGACGGWDGFGRRRVQRSKNNEKPVNINLVVGLDSYNKIEFTGKVSEVNLFNPPLSPERMIDQTAAGGHKCGTQGDLVSWEEAEWVLHSQAKVIEVNSTWEGPCRKESQVQVFDADFKWHHDCMRHCQKISDNDACIPGV